MRVDDEQRYDPARQGERRAPEPLLYTPEQVLGRSPIRLRRAADKRRLALNLAVAVALLALTVWWVFIPHSFAGPVVFVLTTDHGIHLGDLPSLAFVAVACRSLMAARRIVFEPSVLA